MAKNSIYTTPKKSPKRKFSSGRVSKSKRTKKSYSAKKFSKRAAKLAKRAGKPINVANDRELNNVIKRKQKVTRTQQKIINKRFKEGYSPFTKIVTNQIQITNDDGYNKAKWIWRAAATLDFVRECFHYFPMDNSSVGAPLTTSGYYVKSQEQSIYVGKITMQYEILNPTNVDMNLVIYDIVYKDNTINSADSDYNSVNVASNDDNPINLMFRGYNNVSGHMLSTGQTSSSATVVSDPSALDINDINVKPSKSYPFNIYCKILKKQIFRLQPGATMTHIFKYDPKALINLGYMGYKFKEYFSNSSTDANFATLKPAMKDVTCGSLFKFYGQISATGDDSNREQVANIAGKLAIKENIRYKWYAMDNKFNYEFRVNNQWTPTPGDENKMEVVNDMAVHPVQETNTVDTDNDPTQQQP